MIRFLCGNEVELDGKNCRAIKKKPLIPHVIMIYSHKFISQHR